MPFMKDEQLKILQTISQATGRMDLNTLAEKINLNPTQTMQVMQDMVNDGFLQRLAGSYRVSTKGKTAIKACTPLPEGYEFQFYLGVNQSTGQTAKSIVEFYKIIQQVNPDSLKFHVDRGDFERWIMDALNDEPLAKQVAEIREFDYHGEMLRRELLEVIDEHYNVRELI
jgi:hypothetical protein